MADTAAAPSANPTTAAVSDADFADILAATRQFIRNQVVPRELEIMSADRVPDDIREQAKSMGLFGYAIPQEWGGLGLNLKDSPAGFDPSQAVTFYAEDDQQYAEDEQL